MTFITLKSQKKYPIMITVLLACVFWGIAFQSYHKSYQGPLSTIIGVGKDDYTCSSQIAPPGIPVVLGGFPFKTNGQQVTIKSITLSNVPKNVIVGNAGMLISDPEIMIATMPWFKKLTTHSIQSLPMTLSSQSKYWFPVITVTPLKSGRYVFNGLVITYQIGNKQYQDYFRDQFQICAQKGDAPCKDPSPPPMSP